MIWILVAVAAVWVFLVEYRLWANLRYLNDHMQSTGHEWARGIETSAKQHRYVDAIKRMSE